MHTLNKKKKYQQWGQTYAPRISSYTKHKQNQQPRYREEMLV